MSDAPTPTPEPTPPASPAPAPAPEAKKPPRQRRPLRQRILFGLIILFLLVAVGRMLISLLLPVVLGRVMAFYNLSCTYDRVELSVSDGNLNLYNLTIYPRDGGDPIAHTDYIFGNIAPLQLLRGRLYVYRAELDGININVDRNADGSIPLLERFVPATAKTTETTTSTTPPKPVDLASPLKVEAFRLEHVDAHIHDLHVTPALDTNVLLAVRVSDLGVAGKSTTFEVNVAADQLLDDLSLKGHAKLDSSALDAQMTVGIRGLHPRLAAGYLVPAGLTPAADNINLSMSAAVNASPSTTKVGALTGRIAISNVLASADAQQSVRVDKVNIDIDSFDTLALKLANVLVQGVRINTGRTNAGLLRACGLELTPAAPGSSPAAAPTSGPAYGVSVDSVQFKDCRVEMDDQAVTPATTLAVQLDQFTIAAPPSGGPLAIVGKLSIPGVARQIDLSGSTSPFTDTKTAQVLLRVSGVDPTALKPYLDAIGLESQFENGTFACDLDADLKPTPGGKFSANAHLSKVRLADGKELLGLDDVALEGVSADARRIRFDSIAVSGPTILIQRDASGAVSLLGFKTRHPVSSSAAPQTAAAPATTQPAATQAAPKAPLPMLEIGKFVWHGVHVHFDDDGVSPPQSIGVDDVGVELNDLRLGLDPEDYEQNTGKIKAWVVSPHLVDRFEVNGNVAPGPRGLLLDVNGIGSGVSPSALATYLEPLGLDPLTTNGSVNFHAQLALGHQKGTFNIGLALDQIKYADPKQTLLAVDSLKVGNVAIAGSNIGVTDVAIDHPEARIERDAQGKLIVAGIKLVESPPSARAGSPVPSPGTPGEGQGGGVANNLPTHVPATSAALPPPQPSPGVPGEGAASGTKMAPSASPLVAKLNSLNIQHAQLWWIDHAVLPEVDTSLTADVSVSHLTYGEAAPPADVHIVASIPNVIQQLDVAGQISPAPDAQSAHLNISANDIILGPLASYLPAGITSTLQDGSLHLSLDAAIAKVAKGGQSAKLSVDQLDYKDTSSPTSLFKLGNLTLACSRIDPEGGVIAIDELSTHGIECDVTQLPKGETSLLGLKIGAAPESGAPKPSVKVETAAQAAVPAMPSAAPAPVVDAAALVAQAHKALPLITIGKLDLNVSRFSVINGVDPSAAPLSVEDLQLTNKAPIEWLGHDAESRPASLLQLTTKVAPIADKLSVGIKATPFARQPAASVDLAISGIHGDGLTKLSPPLQKTLDGSGMTNGQFEAHVEALLKLERRSPIDFDLSHPFSAEFDLTKVEYRSAPNSPVLAGIDEVRSDGIRVIPATGSVSIKTIELTNPNAVLVRDTDGIHALGWVLKAQKPPETQPAATQPTTKTTAKSKSKEPVKPQVVSAAPVKPTTSPIPTSEIKIDHIVASGMNVVIEDKTTKPPTFLPLTGLDMEIRDVSSLALYEDKPFRFNALVNSGKVNLPARSGVGNENRDLFSQFTMSGKIGLYPELNGWAKIALSGFDLGGASAEAAVEGITLTKGAFDADIDMHFEPGNVVNVQSKLIFTDMSLAEPPKGPISRILALPAPLDVVLGILEDPDGSITLPVNFPLKDFKPQGIAGAAVGAVGSVIVTAVASAPLKALNGAASIFGLGPKKPGEEQQVVLDYDPGAILLEAPQQAALSLLVQRMLKEPNLQLTIAHEFGSSDFQTVAARANPSTDEATALAYRLRARKLELSSLRAQVSGQAEAQLATFDETSAAPTLDRLRAIDRDLAVTETALDRTYDLLRAGADRQADRRTRAAALEIASQRLDAVRATFRSAGVADVEGRIKLLRPALTPSQTHADSTILIQPVQTKG
jgi:hypothetical protein